MKLKEYYIVKQVHIFQNLIFLMTAHFKNLRKPHLPYPHVFPTTLQLNKVEYSFSNHFILLYTLYLSKEE